MKPNHYEAPVEEAVYSKDADRLKFAMNAAGIGVWEVDVIANKVIWDDRCRELFGLAKDNVLPYELATRYIHPDDVEEVNKQVQAALQGENSGIYNATYRTIGADDGKLRWVNFTGAAYFDEVGKVVRFGGVAQEVTQIQEAQQKILASQQQIISLLEQSSVAIAINKREGLTFTNINAFYAQLVGRSPEEIIGKPLAEVFPELEGKGFDDLLNNVLNTGVPYFATERAIEIIRNGKEETLYVNFAYHPLHNDGRTVSSTLTIVTDVTPQVLARKSVEESEARFRSFVEQAPVAMFIFRGEDLVISTANKIALSMIRRSADAIGKPLLVVVPELQGSDAYQTFQEVYRTGQPQYGREVLVPLEREGVLEDRYFNFAYMPLYENAQVVGVMDVATEVTDQVLARKKIEEVVAVRTRELAEANQALKQSIKELGRSNQNLEEFAHAASHDLKEPIRKVQVFTGKLKSELNGQYSEQAARLLVRIENATQRMGMLVEDLLVYSHVSVKPHEQESVDLNDTVKRVLEDLELHLEQKDAVVETQPLPVVQGYRRQLQQLLQNLISNAVKYSRPGVAPLIQLYADKQTVDGKPCHCIYVKDNGIGIEPAYFDKIFEMFARLHGKTEYEGTGIGLSIVKKVVENHHGSIEVESVPEQGAAFKVYLPATT